MHASFNAGLPAMLRRFHAPLAPTLAFIVALAGCGREQTPPLIVSGGKVEQGKALMAQFQCGVCHAIPGVEAARGATGPDLALFARRSYIAGHLPNTPEKLVQWIVDPPAMSPGTLMPNVGVSAEDARHMAAYLYTLR
jgi:cytochrome c